jgi:hypothetical protein
MDGGIAAAVRQIELAARDAERARLFTPLNGPGWRNRHTGFFPFSSLFFCQAEAARRKENKSVRQQLDLNVRRTIGHLPITER